MIDKENRTPRYQGLLDFYLEQMRWVNGNMSLASEKRARAALKKIGLADDEIEDFFRSI